MFKKKTDQDNTIRHKARVVSRGFKQIPGVDCSESFALVASDTSIRVIVAMFLYYHHRDKKSTWDLEMFDVEAAFLNADLDKQVFIKWPQGILDLGLITEEDKVNKCTGKCLRKHKGQTVMKDEYRSLLGEIMYYTTNLVPELNNSAIGITAFQSR
jgi:Reverse transcriptase (RNA-dependent DNA polymerase)